MILAVLTFINVGIFLITGSSLFSEVSTIGAEGAISSKDHEALVSAVMSLHKSVLH